MKRDKNFIDFQKVPWKPLLVVLATSFISAAVLSLAASYVFFPEGRLRLAKGSSNFSLDQDQRGLSKDDLSAIMQRNLFKSEDTDTFDKGGERVVVEEVIKSTLPLKLIGTIYSSDSLNGIAIVKFTNAKNTNSFINGDTIVDQAILKEVHKEKIIIDNNGQLEFIEVDKKELVRKRRKVSKRRKRRKYAAIATAPAAKEFREEGFERRGSDITMSKDYKARLLGPEFTKVLQDAKASPNLVGGKLRGFVLNRIRENSIYQKAGLQNKDVVEEINGIMLTDTAQTIKLLNSLRNEDEIEMRVVRGGKPINFVVSVK